MIFIAYITAILAFCYYCIFLHILLLTPLFNQTIGLMRRMFTLLSRVQSQVESYQKLKKWYLMPPCFTFSSISCGSKVKWSNLGNRVTPFPTPRYCSYWKESLRVAIFTFSCALAMNCVEGAMKTIMGSVPVCVIPKTLKTVLDTSLLNTQQDKVHI